MTDRILRHGADNRSSHEDDVAFQELYLGDTDKEDGDEDDLSSEASDDELDEAEVDEPLSADASDGGMFELKDVLRKYNCVFVDRPQMDNPSRLSPCSLLFLVWLIWMTPEWIIHEVVKLTW
ncbi:hypothetical protein SDRG_00834 [Saprolegnia diclina VS20]|uniref:Uncharacterized protein n=1 Tax=Saprolegnia diclina (strain VS20) TaxID=1156394 RepID=T0R6C2_SAPDV|nr:hypothetical protein SDRG_00834 [Saprolegnia diclina VS20]EQC41985.1 hypothetical protein SDRG_00834 [Saprolegnia diclina VS20]|eukprot:XP_008604554.1 hypothetical protein SDRG_00834 [Saprolegnia diclina VS20]